MRDTFTITGVGSCLGGAEILLVPVWRRRGVFERRAYEGVYSLAIDAARFRRLVRETSGAPIGMIVEVEADENGAKIISAKGPEAVA